MKRATATAILSVVILGVAGSAAHALYRVYDKGDWPKSWPAELEPLRTQSRTYVGPMIDQRQYHVPFASREAFEAAWPHLLATKTKGAPIVLQRGPHTWLGTMKAGVIVHTPPDGTNRRVHPEAPLAGDRNERGTWMWTNYIELVVDGDVVDLNRLPLPAETPIIDQRFKPREKTGEKKRSD